MNLIVAATEVEEIVEAQWKVEEKKVDYNKRKDEQIEKISKQVGFIK
jgi:L(+)-tartrate dehydratase beta subunit